MAIYTNHAEESTAEIVHGPNGYRLTMKYDDHLVGVLFFPTEAEAKAYAAKFLEMEIA